MIRRNVICTPVRKETLHSPSVCEQSDREDSATQKEEREPQVNRAITQAVHENSCGCMGCTVVGLHVQLIERRLLGNYIHDTLIESRQTGAYAEHAQ